MRSGAHCAPAAMETNRPACGAAPRLRSCFTRVRRFSTKPPSSNPKPQQEFAASCHSVIWILSLRCRRTGCRSTKSLERSTPPNCHSVLKGDVQHSGPLRSHPRSSRVERIPPKWARRIGSSAVLGLGQRVALQRWPTPCGPGLCSGLNRTNAAANAGTGPLSS